MIRAAGIRKGQREIPSGDAERYQSIDDTLVQLCVPQTSDGMASQQPDSFGMQQNRNEGEGT